MNGKEVSGEECRRTLYTATDLKYLLLLFPFHVKTVVISQGAKEATSQPL
jgi:hypothetical protein